VILNFFERKKFKSKKKIFFYLVSRSYYQSRAKIIIFKIFKILKATRQKKSTFFCELIVILNFLSEKNLKVKKKFFFYLVSRSYYQSRAKIIIFKIFKILKASSKKKVLFF